VQVLQLRRKQPHQLPLLLLKKLHQLPLKKLLLQLKLLKQLHQKLRQQKVLKKLKLNLNFIEEI
jgi:hypothetical protein